MTLPGRRRKAGISYHVTMGNHSCVSCHCEALLVVKIQTVSCFQKLIWFTKVSTVMPINQVVIDSFVMHQNALISESCNLQL